MSDEIEVGRVEEGECFTLEELCSACALEEAWVVRRVGEGLFPAIGAQSAEWRFGRAALARARRMRDFERDFDAVPELAALVADLLEEMDTLRAKLRRAGLG